MILERVRTPFGKPRLRIIIVLLLATFSLATALPNYLYIVFPIYGHFGFVADEHGRVLMSFRPNLKAGDIIDWRALPFDERYDSGEFGRMARAGTRVVFPVIRNGTRVDVPLVSEFHRQRFGGPGALWLFSIKKSAELLIVFLGAGLVLLRPSRMSWLFFIYAAALAADGAPFWSFLPAWAFTTLTSIALIFAIPFPPAALTFFALELPAIEQSRKVKFEYAVQLVFALSTAAFLGWIARDYFVVPLGSWISTAAVLGTLALWLTAIVVLTTNAWYAFRARTSPLGWVCAALFGSALCYAYIDAADLAGGQAFPSPDYWGLFSLVLSLAGVYSIVQGRIIDVRYAIARATLSAAIGCCSIALFALINLVFATEIARFSFIIPIEIVVAALLGFRFSGLQDAEAAINLVSADAASARIRGDRTAERDALTRALARAERTRNASLIVNVRAHAAFGEWFAGDDREFERHIQALAVLARNKPLRGLMRFTRCAIGAIYDGVPEQRELPDWTARTELVACWRANDAVEAGHYAALALSAARTSGDAFLIAISSLALAEFEPGQRHALYEDALHSCEEAGALTLCESIRAVAAGSEHIGLLEQFVNKRLRIQRGSRPSLEIRFADASVRMYGEIVQLRPREQAMLLLIALTPEGASFDALSDRVWPDLDGDAAHNTMRVNLHRLRKALGDDAAIVKSNTRYRLRRGSVVDMWAFTECVASLARARILTHEQRTQLDKIFQELRTGKRRRPVHESWFYRVEQSIAHLTHETGRFLAEDALRQGDYARAIQIGTTLLDDDAADEIACELVLRARLACGDATGALAIYRQYCEKIASSSLAEPSPKIEALVAEARAVR